MADHLTDPETSPSIPPAPPPHVDVATERRWRRRPLLRAAIRIAAVLAPAAAAITVAIAYSRTVPPPAGIGGAVVWWALFGAAVLATWVISAELLQRILPLAALLDLTLVFPGSVPSRVAIFRRRSSRHLETDLRRLRERSDPESGTRAQLILELAVALSIHDSRTRGHSERVRTFTDLVARELHLRPSDADRLRWAALLHDIGKLAVAPEILNKPELPDDDERQSLRSHPVEGYWMIAPLHKWLGPWAATVRDHHERFDGTGYPNGLSGRAISLGGRIVAVTDSYETMTSGRPYRKALSVTSAREELVRRSGTHFDPYVVRAFLAISLGRLWPVVGIGALIAEVPLLAPISWRLTHLGSRTVSGLAAAGAAATLVVAGLAGPVAGVTVYGPAKQSVTARVVPHPSQGASTRQVASPLTPIGGSTASSNQSSTATATSGAGSTAPSPAPPSGGGSAAYPAGIAKHSTLPPGIAKQPDPFAQWRAHH